MLFFDTYIFKKQKKMYMNTPMNFMTVLYLQAEEKENGNEAYLD